MGGLLDLIHLVVFKKQFFSSDCVMERKSLFGAQSRSWTPLENEFLAENETIEIIPNFSCPKRHFIQVLFFEIYIPIETNTKIYISYFYVQGSQSTTTIVQPFLLQHKTKAVFCIP